MEGGTKGVPGGIGMAQDAPLQLPLDKGEDLVRRFHGLILNPIERPASFTTSNLIACDPSTTHDVSTALMRSALTVGAPVCRPSARTARMLPGRLGKGWPRTARPRSGRATCR